MALSRISSFDSKPLEHGKIYHFSILYNHHKGPASSRTADHILAWNVLKNLVEISTEHGYDRVMYQDIAIPGSNIFDIFFDLVNESEKIVVLLTPEFMKNGWHTYSQQAAIKNLFDKQEAHMRFVPVAININENDIPDNLGLSVSMITFTGFGDNGVDDGVWDRVLGAIGYREIHQHQESCDLTATVQSVQVSEPHDNHTNNLNNSSLEVDAVQSADDAEDRDREASRGNAASTNRNAQEQFADSNFANQQDDDYKGDNEETALMSNDISLRGSQTGLTQLVTSKSDPELPKRQEGEGVPRETTTDSNRKTDEPGKEQTNVPSEPPQTRFRRVLSWCLEMIDDFSY